MAVMDSILAEELDHLKALSARFEEERATLPAGSVVINRKRGRDYAYLEQVGFLGDLVIVGALAQFLYRRDFSNLRAGANK